MIPKQLTEIEWSDILALLQLGRAEDDRIEYKSSFKGLGDYASLNENQRQQALDALAREAIAFLNTRGGDIIVGIEETGPSSAAASVRAVKNPLDTAERVARGLAALVEPAQTNISVKGLASPENDSEGVLIIRVEASVRAPHRSKRTLICYARRGSETVPMPMDEIQDLTINRNRLRLEQMDFLDRQFSDFVDGKVEHRDLGHEGIHIRTVCIPLLEQSFGIDDAVLGALGNSNPTFYNILGKIIQNDVAFRGLHSRWIPVLRGKKKEDFYEKNDTHNDFQYARKVIKQSGVCIFDFAANSHFDSEFAAVHADWLIGYFAQVLDNLRALARMRPVFPCTLRIGVSSKGTMHLAYGEGMWAARTAFPQNVFFLPDFTPQSSSELDEIFDQFQVDLFSLANLTHANSYTFRNPLEQA